MKYISSDLHFRHKNILKLQGSTRGQWPSLEDMEVDLINMINALPDCEMFYHLGDFAFGSNTSTRSISEQIKQPMTFILGNHDRSKRHILEEFGTVDSYMEIHHSGKKVCLFHYPQLEWNAGHHGSIQLHGHVHGNLKDIKGKTIDVGWDAHGRILTLDEAVAIADAKELWQACHYA